MNSTSPTLTVRKSEDRGHADHGWLNAKHSFSFAGYYDPDYMGFRSLRVINEDRIAPGGGFPTHPHENMEIFTYVLEGALQHQDSMGNGRALRPGQIQMMSAGSGVTHSEFNPSSTEPLHLLQIWIQPHTPDLEPTYTEWEPDQELEQQPKVLIISPDGREKSALIRQDAEVYRLKLQPGETVEHDLAEGRGLWLQVIHGPVTLNDTELASGDAAHSEDAGKFRFTAGDQAVEALLFDLK
jgi:redox-sensitive bicupin YhaK (pirin superfamily)